jgi:succinate dehydrogenase / fumarate reductase cytochrome b subunit
MFQTFGVRNHRWSCGLRRFSAVFCLVYFLGNLAIPGAIVTGLAKPAVGTHAAKKVAAVSAPSSSVAQR